MTKTQELTKQVMELNMKQTEEMAIEIKGIYDSYIKAGFTEEQAWQLLALSMVNAFKGGN